MTPLGLPLFHYDGGKWIMGSSPQAYNHLKSFQRIELQVVLSAPRNQLLSAHQLLYETNQCCVICKLQKSYRRGSEGTTSVGVQRVHPWRQITSLRMLSLQIFTADVIHNNTTLCVFLLLSNAMENVKQRSIAHCFSCPYWSFLPSQNSSSMIMWLVSKQQSIIQGQINTGHLLGLETKCESGSSISCLLGVTPNMGSMFVNALFYL